MKTLAPNDLAAAADRVRRRRDGAALKAVYAPLPLAESLAAYYRDVAALADGYLALAPRPKPRTRRAFTAPRTSP